MNIEELIKSNANLEDYLKEYCESSSFIYHYYLQDLNRIARNYYMYSSFLQDEDKIKLISKAINILDYEVINIIIKDLDNTYISNDSYKETINKVFNELVDLDKDGKIDINKITGSVFLYRSNPVYFVKKNPKNIRYCYNLKYDVALEILEYLASINYHFIEDDCYFIDHTIIANPDLFIFFLNNFNYDFNVDLYIRNKIKDLTKKEKYSLYEKIISNGKNNFANEIVHQLNINNYDYGTIIKDQDLCLVYDEKNHNNIFSLLSEINKNGFSANVILVMKRVNMDIVNEAYKFVGNNLKILPLANQMTDTFDEYYQISHQPYYDYENIKKSEDKLDLYAKMVMDTKDKDGDIKSLSPLEKYIAAYILTSKFAPYKEEGKGDKGYTSRSVYEFINSITNTKIVCVGYTHLLQEILYRMGIKDTAFWSVNINENKVSDTNDHARMMIHLVDSKYGIDGIYMADPTFDNTESSKKKFDHMLMSHDELTEIDREVTNSNLKADEYTLMESSLKVKDAYTLFHKPIPKDALIKAHLAVEHFLDKNMKMVDNYDFLEYAEMASKLHIYDVYQNNRDKIFHELGKMSINEINYNYPGLLDDFFYDLFELIGNKMKENGVNSNLICTYDHEKDMALIGYSVEFQTEEFTERNMTVDDVIKLSEIIPLNRISKKNGEARFYIKLDNDKTIIEQYDEIVNKLCQINDVITSKKNDNKLK